MGGIRADCNPCMVDRMQLSPPIHRNERDPPTPLRARIGGQASLTTGVIALLFTLLFAGPSGEVNAQRTRDGTVVLIDIKGAIGFVTAAQLASAAEQATAQGAHSLIVRLDTPGGLLSSTREMIQAILASRVPVVVYVAPGGSRAASAGTYLAYASHIAAMSPGTHLGAATPIALSAPGLPGSPPSQKPSPGSDKQSDPDPATTAARKSINDAVAYIRTLAELRGRNADWGGEGGPRGSDANGIGRPEGARHRRHRPRHR